MFSFKKIVIASLASCALLLQPTTALAAEKTSQSNYTSTTKITVFNTDLIKNQIKANVNLYLTQEMNNNIAAAAQELVGITDGWQCTEVATQALINAGLSASVHWPDTYIIYGQYVSLEEAQPGNLIYYNNGGRGIDHIAIYIGNGLAVHGNYCGRTVIESIYTCPGAPQFIQVSLQ